MILLFAGCAESASLRMEAEPPRQVDVIATEAVAGGYRASLRIQPGPGNARFELRSGSTRRELNKSEWIQEDSEVEVSLAGLAPGKYSLLVSAPGSEAPLARLPFWVEAERFDWRGALLYMVMVDRFWNGRHDNDVPPAVGATPSTSFQGGDLSGLTAAVKAGVFDELGVRALWLSPIVENADALNEEGGHGVTAYHGYWPVKGRAVDARFGSAEELDELVSAAHARGIRILLDFVVNHVHEQHEYVSSHPDWFRRGCKCGTPGCDWTEKRLECLFHPTLPDVNWGNPDAAVTMIDDAVWWLDRFDVDGFRIDAVKHVEDEAMFQLGRRIRHEFERGGTDYFLLGETAMGWRGHSLQDNLSEYETISRYVAPDALDGQFDFVLHHATAYRVFTDHDFGMPHLDYWTQQSLAQYPEQAIMTPFLGSHDSSRLLSLCERTSRDPNVHNKWPEQGLPSQPHELRPYQCAAQALTWLLTTPGAPLLYYGDEYGEFGGADPDNRHMWRPKGARSAFEAEQFEIVKRAGQARRKSAALRLGSYQPLLLTETLLIFLRRSADDIAVVALNLGQTEETKTVTLPAGAPGVFVDALQPSATPFQAKGRELSVTVPAVGSVVLLPSLGERR